MRWFIFDGDIKKGPYGAADVREMLREGTLSLDSFVMREGSPLKRRLFDVVEGLAQDLVAERSPARPRSHASALAPQPPAGAPPARAPSKGEFGGRTGRTVVTPPVDPASSARPAQPVQRPVSAVPLVRSTFQTGPLSNSQPSNPAPAGAQGASSPYAEELERLRAENERLLQERQKAEVQGVVTHPAQQQAPAPFEIATIPLRKAAGDGREAPEHQRARVESEGRLDTSGEKIQWQKNRVNMTSNLSGGQEEAGVARSEGILGSLASPAPKAAIRGYGGGGRPSPHAKVRERHGGGRGGAPGRTPHGGTFSLFPFVMIGMMLFAVVVAVFAHRMSSMKERVSASREAREDAEWLATQALMKAEQTRAQAEKEMRDLAERQKAEVRNATIRARNEARKAMTEVRKKKEAVQKAAANNAAKKSSQNVPKKQQANALASTSKPKSTKKSARKKTSTPQKKQPTQKRAAVAFGPPAPGWPPTVVSSRSQLRANAFRVVSVVGIRVNSLPTAGCSPCQTRGTLPDGTAVILVAPTFTPFVPASMAGANRVAVKALVQASGEFRLLVQSAIKN